MAHFYFLKGAPEAANAVLVNAPEGYIATHSDVQRRADAAEAQGDAAGALQILGEAIGKGATPAPADIPAELALKYCEMAVQMGQTDAVRQILLEIIAVIDTLHDVILMRLVKLGERAEQLDVALAAINEIATRNRIRPSVAQFLVRRAHMVMDSAGSARLAQALEAKLQPSEQPEFRVFAAATLSGPDAALALARSGIQVPATVLETRIIAEQILGVGKSRLALRYLRRAINRWPNKAHLRALFMRACAANGDLAAGHVMLDALTAANPEVSVDLNRIELLVEGGHLEQAVAILEKRQARGLKAVASMRAIEIYLALGRYEDALKIESEVRRSPAIGRQTASHFGITLVGSRLKDQGLYREDAAHLRSTGMAEDEITRRMARKFFYPAKFIIDDWLKGADISDPAKATTGNIPRNVMQYWNAPLPPAEVQAVMESWRVPGFEHTVYDRLSALAFLRKNFGEKHVHAFSLANSAAEECDFLRLCLLYKFGGIYVDADDRLNSDPSALLAQGNGMIVVRETMGAIANNLICARPGHPVLNNAIALAGRSLLNRENDNTWSKTGPGLMTRAIALYLHATDDAESRNDLTIITTQMMRRHVQPHVRLSYKTTAHYWNARDGRVSDQIVAALSRIG
ncbi:glycosyltransferase [Sulfitobacter guttiformis]|uniref:Glycosyl transferase-like sugar-binding protein n=1 Tax=Sulfitobacter guttiformis TaxID=74349 RepID=A0A420DTP3_9RHOB|nr:glycosyltransferase [Sulfitobacter guttiformis]KIN74912.1 Mannosyltransferase OCH1-like enzyme [Sulfitobacter guttiformis KCTC 32187]RKE97477.1 glycosyl transferase-like sugar-binding protein [Sulfitobacter guttiformis]